MFPCGRWLARGEDDGAIERELLPDKITKEMIGRDGQLKTQDVKIRDKLKGQLQCRDRVRYLALVAACCPRIRQNLWAHFKFSSFCPLDRQWYCLFLSVLISTLLDASTWWFLHFSFFLLRSLLRTGC